MAKIEFGWFVPPIGIAETEYVPLAKWQQDKILPVVVEHFDSLWAPDHFYAFEDPANPWPPLSGTTVSAGPFYLVWEQPERSGVGSEQWPYQLATLAGVESPAHR